MNPYAHQPRATAARPTRCPQPAADVGAAATGPHDPQLTAVLGRQIDELSRALNYATRAAGLEYAADVYEVLGSVSAELAKLPLACAQLADFLARHDSAGALRAARWLPPRG